MLREIWGKPFSFFAILLDKAKKGGGIIPYRIHKKVREMSDWDVICERLCARLAGDFAIIPV